jgi:hypothetical protein
MVALTTEEGRNTSGQSRMRNDVKRPSACSRFDRCVGSVPVPGKPLCGGSRAARGRSVVERTLGLSGSALGRNPPDKSLLVLTSRRRPCRLVPFPHVASAGECRHRSVLLPRSITEHPWPPGVTCLEWCSHRQPSLEILRKNIVVQCALMPMTVRSAWAGWQIISACGRSSG